MHQEQESKMAAGTADDRRDGDAGTQERAAGGRETGRRKTERRETRDEKREQKRHGG
jgi:hypothetical protein